jgi:hypothetical protein
MLSGHALEQQRIAPIVAKQRLCEAAKGVMNVVGRHDPLASMIAGIRS